MTDGVDQAPVAPNEVAEPIINSPFAEPAQHWQIEKGTLPVKVPGRRPASFYYRVPDHAKRGSKKQGSQRPLPLQKSEVGQQEDLILVNWLRARVKDWREAGWPGTSPVTRELLQLWRAGSDQRAQRLFFAQIEAAETIIFLMEGAESFKKGMPPVPRDKPGAAAKAAGFSSFARYACKMATGSGKSTVMGMLAAWSILNRVAEPTDDRFSDTILIVCPNITIRDRLRELDPALGDISLYRTRQLVPPQRMEDLRKGEVMIANWHKLAKQEANTVNGDSARVVKTGVPVEVVKNAGKANESVETRYLESDRKWLNRIRSELGNGRGKSPRWLVFNDEAHHAYRRGDADETVSLDETEDADRGALAKKNAREATIWIEGLDRINKLAGGGTNKKGIGLCVDLSATPFYIQGSGNEVGRPFPWIVSDFGLLDAIESGLVKLPQLPTRDITGASEATYFNIWRWIEQRAQQDGHGKRLTPELVMTYATAPINQLAEDWHARFQQWQVQQQGELHPVPPVFIVVCRDTKIASAVYDWLAEDKGAADAPAWFRNKPGEEVTVRIDSKVAEDMEEGGTKDETRRLRFILDTVGKKTWPGGKVPEDWAELVRKNNEKAANDETDADGNPYRWINEHIPPGRDIRCIVSVAMLSEGWDANTVTHIVGLRPFGSQLLCEQVLGRALRRLSYALDETTDRFAEETAKVFGVPFEIVPFKESKSREVIGKPAPAHIFSVPEKARFEIEFPVVEGYFTSGRPDFEVDWSTVPTLTIDPMEIPNQVQLNSLTAPEGSLAAYGPGEKPLMTLADWRARFREQQVAFRLAREIARRWQEAQAGQEKAAAAPAQTMFPHAVAAAQRFLADRGKLICKGNSEPVDVLLVAKYAQIAVDSLFEALRRGSRPGAAAELPRIPNGAAGRGSTRYVDFHTIKPICPANKCHLNAMAADTEKWEQSAGFVLDTHRSVERWVKNEHLGLRVPYRRDGVPANYIPDFIAVLLTGLRLLIEVKGQYGDDADRKAEAARRWAAAVTRHGESGTWQYVIVTDPPALAKWLDELAPAERTALSLN